MVSHCGGRKRLWQESRTCFHIKVRVVKPIREQRGYSWTGVSKGRPRKKETTKNRVLERLKNSSGRSYWLTDRGENCAMGTNKTLKEGKLMGRVEEGE